MKKRTLLALLSALILCISFQAAGGDEVFSGEQYADRLTNLEKSLQELSPAFLPTDDVSFLELIQELKKYPDSKSFQIFKVLKISVEFYKKNLESQVDHRRERMLKDLSLLITSSRPYFARTKNEVAQQYFENLDLFVAKATEVKLSHNGYSDGSKPTDAESKQKEKDLAIESAHIKESVYQDFVVRIINDVNNKKQPISKNLIDEANELKRIFNETNPRDQGPALGKMKSFADNALRYSAEKKYEYGVKFFQNYLKYVETEKAKFWDALQDAQLRSFNDELNRQERELDLKEVRNFLLKTQEFIEDAGKKDSDKELKVSVKGTTFKFTYKEIHIEKSSENVIFMTDKNKEKRIFTFNIIEASPKVKEAITVAMYALLKHTNVYGVYFDNGMRIPTDLNKDKFEVRSLGKGRVLLRQRALVCSGFFS